MKWFLSLLIIFTITSCKIRKVTEDWIYKNDENRAIGIAAFVNEEQTVIEEYFEINAKNLGKQLRNKGINFLTINEIEEQKIKSYIHIDLDFAKKDKKK